MTTEIQKMIVIPVDGSQNAMKALDYIDLMFGPRHNLNVSLVYIIQRLPRIVVEESRKDRDARKQLEGIEKRNIEMAEKLLKESKERLIKVGFTPKTVEAVFRQIEVGVARDICSWAERKQADAIVVSFRGKSRLEAFFLGEVAAKILEYSRVCPVWMVKGSVPEKNVLLALDNSENAMRAADHAGFMLAGTGKKVTIYHSKRDLKRFVAKEVLDEFPEFQKFWKHKAGEVIAPYMQKALNILLAAGLDDDQIEMKVVDGSRHVADDILKEAYELGAGTIILGLKGSADVKEFRMGTVTRKVLSQAADMTIAIVP